MRQADRIAWPVPATRLVAWILALVFLATGLGKALDVAGFAAVLDEYRLFPRAPLLPIAALIVVVELGIAVGLAQPRWRHGGAIAAGAVSAANALVLTATLIRGIPLENCGCFGVFLGRPLTWATPIEDLILLTLAVFVARRT
ncbi:MauE/DoxX family redox-associated membrane protein [Plastoroseomonas arctica]|uniref:Methylamine utilization protein MauE n=1 Tax=Plastoroseomonas arctica TaxID=1509237 RepID=A0AAF1KQ03_9PROT|nr:hypothetical protein [Plastoroseomonas arctica]